MDQKPSHADIQKLTVLCKEEEFPSMISEIEKMGSLIFKIDTDEGFVCLIINKNPIVFTENKETFDPIEEKND